MVLGRDLLLGYLGPRLSLAPGLTVQGFDWLEVASSSTSLTEAIDWHIVLMKLLGLHVYQTVLEKSLYLLLVLFLGDYKKS